MMVCPEITVSASKAAIRIWMSDVVPSLLPFMIAAGCIKMTGANYIVDSLAYPVFMAFLSGYPMGAKLAGNHYREGHIDRENLHRLLCYAMITGPAFLVGGVGVAFYGEKIAGYILVISHYAGAATTGLLLGKGRVRGVHSRERRRAEVVKASDMTFTDCILESFRTLGIVLAYIVLFMIGTDFMESMGMLQNLPAEAAAFCKGLLEMTVGCSEIAVCGCSLQRKLVLSSFIVSFGGLSVIGQTMSMLSGCPVTLVEILKIKMLHGTLSAIWTFTICTFVV